jgi:hypothetical protein
MRGNATLPEEQLAAVRQRSGARSIADLRGAVGVWVQEMLAEEERQKTQNDDTEQKEPKS